MKFAEQSMKIPQRLLGEALLFSEQTDPDKTAIIAKGKEFSYSLLKGQTISLAGYLIQAGLRREDRVAVYMNNSWQSIVSVYGITIAGGVIVVINPQTRADKLQFILNDSGARILITEELIIKSSSRALMGIKNLKEIIITGTSDTELNVQGLTINYFEKVLLPIKPDRLPVIIPNDLAALIYTSGSTGIPKGVMMTHQAMVFTSWSLIEYLRLTPSDRIMLFLPLAFDYGLYQLLMSVSIGGTLIVEELFILPSVCKHIEKYRPTVFPGVPTTFAMLISENKRRSIIFDCIEKVTSTAAALPVEFIPDIKKIFPRALIFKMYGLSECKRVCYLEPELVDFKPDSVGKAIPGTEVFLLTPEGMPVSTGEPGILHIRGPHLMSGYWNNEALSREMLKDGKFPGDKILCSNDWFRTDKEGYLYFIGRNDDMIKTRGEKVSTAEIENVIYKINGIKEVAVIGIPDIIMGESIIAFVTVHEPDTISGKDIQRECISKIEEYMIPQKIFILDELPKSSNGKIDKKELKRGIGSSLS